jgi:hypothetical protein
MAIDHFDRGDIHTSIWRVDALVGSGIFSPQNAQHVLFRAAFIEVLIALRDLMYKTEKYASRIAFQEDVQVTQSVHDVSDLIKFVRDALCHPDSENHYIEHGNLKASFNVLFGSGTLLKAPNFEQASPYADDICFFFGSQRIYLKRHILRAYEEAKSKLLPLVSASYS